MIIKNSRSSTPAWNTTIWRYMSFEKFLDIILNNRLFFTNATRFTDKNEGTISELTQSKWQKKLIREGKNENDAASEVSALQMNIDIQRHSSYINCWTIDPDESFALWKIYLSGSKSGVAIRTNVKKLLDSINSPVQNTESELYLEKVTYDDFIKEPVDIIGALTTKGKCYKYESELRIIKVVRTKISRTIGKPMTRNGISIAVKPHVLIDQIYLSPFSGKLLNKILVQALEKIDPIYINRIKESEIDDL
jgi:hypothetical protein